MQDMNDKVTGDTLSADEWDQAASEVQNVITDSGQALSGADLNQLGKGVAKYSSGGATACTDSGTANAVVLSNTNSLKTPTAYFTGMLVRFLAAATNSGATTLNAYGLGAKKLFNPTGSDLVANDKLTGVYYIARYDASLDSAAGAWVLDHTGVVPVPSAVYPPNYLTGLTLSNNSLDAVNDIDIAAGNCKDSTNTQDFTVSSALGKRIDAAWAAAGTPASTTGGFPTGITLTNNTWYRVFLIATPSGTVNAGFDTSATATNLLTTAAVVSAGYTKYRQIGWIRYATATIQAFRQVGDRFMLNAGQQISTAAITTSRTLITAFAPPDTSVFAMGMVSIFDTSTAGTIRYLNICPTAVADAAVTSTNASHSFYEHASNSAHDFQFLVQMDTSSQFAIRASGGTMSNTTTSAMSQGWVDGRGQ